VRLVIQRSGAARVTATRSRDDQPIDHEERIEHGLVVLACAERGDDGDVFRWAARKVAQMRLFPDENGKMNRSVRDAGGQVLVVSQFTLAGDAAKGNRPSFTRAAPPEEAEPLVELLARELESEHGLRVARGVFGGAMQVELVNDGPVTIILERRPGP
jgi:D-tyrosyl-tRNA(Tyr) deacylase